MKKILIAALVIALAASFLTLQVSAVLQYRLNIPTQADVGSAHYGLTASKSPRLFQAESQLKIQATLSTHFQTKVVLSNLVLEIQSLMEDTGKFGQLLGIQHHI